MLDNLITSLIFLPALNTDLIFSKSVVWTLSARHLLASFKIFQFWLNLIYKCLRKTSVVDTKDNFTNSDVKFEFHIFWEGHKILKESPKCFDKLCAHLRAYELYRKWVVVMQKFWFSLNALPEKRIFYRLW